MTPRKSPRILSKKENYEFIYQASEQSIQLYDREEHTSFWFDEKTWREFTEFIEELIKTKTL